MGKVEQKYPGSTGKAERTVFDLEVDHGRRANPAIRRA